MNFNIDKIIEVLQENSLRVTKPRSAVAGILVSSNTKYLSSEEIYLKISKKKNVTCDLVSVYRILATFEELDIIKKTEFNNEACRYTLQDSEYKSRSRHEHYFNCFVSRKEKELESSGYQKLTHHLEISGLCPTCAA